MFKKLLGTLACCGLLSGMAGYAGAGTIMAAEFAGQPLIYQKEGRVTGCGVRLLGLSKYSSPRDLVRVVDASFSVYADGMSLMKAGVSTTTGAGISSQTLNLKPVRIAGFWMRREGGNPTTPLDGKVHRSPDDPNFVLYATSMESLAALTETVYGEVELQVGVRPEKSGVDWVLSGKLVMGEDDIRRFGDCIDTIIKNLDERKERR